MEALVLMRDRKRSRSLFAVAIAALIGCGSLADDSPLEPPRSAAGPEVAETREATPPVTDPAAAVRLERVEVTWRFDTLEEESGCQDRVHPSSSSPLLPTRLLQYLGLLSQLTRNLGWPTVPDHRNRTQAAVHRVLEKCFSLVDGILFP